MKTSQPENENLLIKAKIDSEANRKVSLQLIVSHLTDAVAFGLKQNLLGNDINLEFLVLSVKVFLIESTRSLMNWFQQPAVERSSNNGRNDLRVQQNTSAHKHLNITLQ